MVRIERTLGSFYRPSIVTFLPREKNGVLEHKSDNMSKTRIGKGKVTIWRVYRNYFERYHPRPPTASSSPRLGVRNCYPKSPKLFAVISGMGEATDFKFGRYIHRVHPNKSPSAISEKRERGRISRDCPNFWIPQSSQDRVKLRTSNFAGIFNSINRKEIRFKISGKVAVGVVRDSRKFSGNSIYRRIARSSLR